MKDKILFVDDDSNLLAAFQRNMRKQFDCDIALSGLEALEMFRTKGPYALVLADMNMPGMKGIELLERVRQVSPDTVRMMLTGNADQQTAVDAVNRGQVFRFLSKPAPPELLVPALEAGLKQYSLLRLEREILEGTLAGSIKLLTDVLGMVAPEALGRGQRLRESMSRFARHLGVASSWELELGALLSQIGCASVPPAILQKISLEQPLGTDEAEVLRRVPQIGHDLLFAIPRLAEVAEIVHYQEKRFDGTGFPHDAVEGEVIPLGARVLKILHDRLILEGDGVVKQRAYETMHERKGYYDPYLLDQCFKCFGDFLLTAISHDQPVATLHAHNLTPGDVVVSDIMTKRGMTLVTAGSSLTAMMIARLENFRQIGELQEPLLIQQKATR
jgi:response regulator RpfG family c-di-GMP phosphodiesterase